LSCWLLLPTHWHDKASPLRVSRRMSCGNLRLPIRFTRLDAVRGTCAHHLAISLVNHHSASARQHQSCEKPRRHASPHLLGDAAARRRAFVPDFQELHLKVQVAVGLQYAPRVRKKRAKADSRTTGRASSLVFWETAIGRRSHTPVSSCTRSAV
jgi:hypothetical protein